MACHPLVREVQRRLHAGDFGTPAQVHADLGFVVPQTAPTGWSTRPSAPARCSTWASTRSPSPT